MATITGKLKKPESNKKKIAIIAAAVAVVVLSASGGLYFTLKGGDETDEFGRRRRWNDANMPNPDKQSAKQIIDFRNSERYKKLSQREQMMYTMASGRKLMDYHIDTYFTLPKEQQTQYIDKLIDEMQSMRGNFEQMRRERPRRDANDPNRQARQSERAARRANPSNARARGESGTPLQRAQRSQFMQAMQKRMQQRGISMPGGGPGGFGGGRPGGR